MAQINAAAPHAPKVGRTSRLLGRFHVTGVFWFRVHSWGVRVIPQSLRWIFVRIFTSFFFFCLIRIRDAIAANLDAALGPAGFWKRQRRIYRTFFDFAWCLTERYERLAAGERSRVIVENQKLWRELNSNKEGFILVTGHIGNWEMGSAQATEDEARRVHVVREEELDPRAQEFIQNLLRERMGELYTTHFATDDMTLGLELLDALRRGEIVALQGDRPRTGGRTLPVTLFGRSYALPLGPLILARTAGVPLVPAFILREERLVYRSAVREPIYVENSGNRQADLKRAAAKLIEEIEWAVREKPHQWFCFRNLWPDSE